MTVIKPKDFFKKKSVTAAALITVCTLIYGAVFNGSDFTSEGVGAAFAPILSVISDVSFRIKKTKMYFEDLKSFKQENDKLSYEVMRLKREARSAGEYKAENERLKALLRLKNEIDGEYTSVAAEIVSYEPDNWYDTLMINKGSADGVNVGNPVASPFGTVGKIIKVGKNHSIIATILNLENATGVKNARTGELALVEGDGALSARKLCKMSFAEDIGNVLVGDMVLTSGSGGIYPADLSVGVVTEIKYDRAAPYAVLKPSVDFRSLREVVVICK